MKNLSERTCGELATMRDALQVTRQKIETARHTELNAPLLRILDVLDAIVGERGIQRTHEEYETLRYRSPEERLREDIAKTMVRRKTAGSPAEQTRPSPVKTRKNSL
jgi:hypothetical protein